MDCVFEKYLRIFDRSSIYIYTTPNCNIKVNPGLTFIWKWYLMAAKMEYTCTSKTYNVRIQLNYIRKYLLFVGLGMQWFIIDILKRKRQGHVPLCFFFPYFWYHLVESTCISSLLNKHNLYVPEKFP